MAGKVWLLLPEGLRHQDAGKTYPLPSLREEIQRLVAIPLPPGKSTGGAIYIRRAIKEFRKRQAHRASAALDLAFREEQAKEAHRGFNSSLEKLQSEAQKATEKVKERAEEVISSLGDLFELGKKGMDAQMRAYLADPHGEISHRAFRECFRMVSQAVKGFGIPSKETKKAREAIMEEAAQALKDTQETLSMAPGPKEPETVN